VAKRSPKSQKGLADIPQTVTKTRRGPCRVGGYGIGSKSEKGGEYLRTERHGKRKSNTTSERGAGGFLEVSNDVERDMNKQVL